MFTSTDLISTSYSSHSPAAKIFERHKVVAMPPVMDRLQCNHTAGDVRYSGDDAWIRREAIGSQGDPARFSMMDRGGIEKYAPRVLDWEDWILRLAREVTGMDLILSPWYRSSVNVRKYVGDDTEGRHFDTQPLAALLFLQQGAPLRVECEAGTVDIESIPGRVVLMKGDELIHSVPPGPTDFYSCRIGVCFNLYTPDNTARPAYIDKMLYGNMSYEDATR